MADVRLDTRLVSRVHLGPCCASRIAMVRECGRQQSSGSFDLNKPALSHRDVPVCWRSGIRL